MIPWKMTVEGGNSLEIKTVWCDATAAGDTVVLPAITDKAFYVIQFMMSAADAVDAKFKSGATQITSTKHLGAAAGDALPDAYLFRTGYGEALIVNLSSTVAVGIDLVYLEVGR